MRVYHHFRRRHALFVAPAADPRIGGGADSSWVNDDGTPKNILVDFDADGVAEVPDSVGRYLLATKQARRTRLWLPTFMAA